MREKITMIFPASGNLARLQYRFEMTFLNVNVISNKMRKIIVRSGIRTHAQRTGLRPERSALDRSAILTFDVMSVVSLFKTRQCGTADYVSR